MPAMPKESTTFTGHKPVSESSRKTDAGNALGGDVLIAMTNFADETVKKGIEGLKKEYDKLGQQKPHPSTACKANEIKNRYSNIPCYDHSRVVLKYQSPPESDYIHANRIKSKIASMKINYIATQAPTERTINDFWRMIWQERPKYIVMLCRLVENKKKKCAEYWPKEKDEPKEYGTVTVTNEGDGGKNGELVFDIDKLKVCAEGKQITVKLVRWLDWPDFGIPSTGLGMLRLLRKIESEEGTAILHCSAGIGRTGTLLAAAIIMKALTAGKRVKVPDVIHELRGQRHGLIQTSSQYIYLHFSICTYLERKLKGPATADTLARLKQFFAAYKKFAQEEEKFDRAQAEKGNITRNETNKNA